jgi:hypothetical protein
MSRGPDKRPALMTLVLRDRLHGFASVVFCEHGAKARPEKPPAYLDGLCFLCVFRLGWVLMDA